MWRRGRGKLSSSVDSGPQGDHTDGKGKWKNMNLEILPFKI